MPELKATTCQVFKEYLANYSLLEIMNHAVGNGLAVITGYTYLLQRSILFAEQPCSSGKRETETQHRTKEAFYVQAISQRETELNDFLIHMRDFSRYPTHTRFPQNVARTDVILLGERVVDQLLPLYTYQKVQLHWPAQPLYIRCDPPWIALVVEHLLSHNLAFHDGSEPAEIELFSYQDPSRHVREARMGIHICIRTPKRRPVAEGQVFEAWAQTLNQRDQDVCMALCAEILQEHGGRTWSEQKEGRKKSMYISLPLM